MAAGPTERWLLSARWPDVLYYPFSRSSNETEDGTHYPELSGHRTETDDGTITLSWRSGYTFNKTYKICVEIRRLSSSTTSYGGVLSPLDRALPRTRVATRPLVSSPLFLTIQASSRETLAAHGLVFDSDCLRLRYSAARVLLHLRPALRHRKKPFARSSGRTTRSGRTG